DRQLQGGEIGAAYVSSGSSAASRFGEASGGFQPSAFTAVRSRINSVAAVALLGRKSHLLWRPAAEVPDEGKRPRASDLTSTASVRYPA
ncbi:MAG: hypothetical protein ACOYLV_12090, partial [Rubrivivax sp.]